MGLSMNIMDLPVKMKYMGTFAIVAGTYSVVPGTIAWCVLTSGLGLLQANDNEKARK